MNTGSSATSTTVMATAIIRASAGLPQYVGEAFSVQQEIDDHVVDAVDRQSTIIVRVLEVGSVPESEAAIDYADVEEGRIIACQAPEIPIRLRVIRRVGFYVCSVLVVHNRRFPASKLRGLVNVLCIDDYRDAVRGGGRVMGGQRGGVSPLRQHLVIRGRREIDCASCFVYQFERIGSADGEGQFVACCGDIIIVIGALEGIDGAVAICVGECPVQDPDGTRRPGCGIREEVPSGAVLVALGGKRDGNKDRRTGHEILLYSRPYLDTC